MRSSALVCVFISLVPIAASAQSPLRLLIDVETTPRPPRSSSPSGFVRLGAWTMFTADDGVHGRELHRTAGNPLTTGIVADVRPGPEGSELWGLTPVGTRLLCFADDGVHGREPWVSDGTASGTRLLADLNPGAGSSSSVAFAVGVRAVFSASDGTSTRVLGTDGTPAGTEVLIDLTVPGAPDEVLLDCSAAVEGAAAGAVRYFPTRTGSAIAVWRTDGTRAGTWEVASPPAWGLSAPQPGTVVVAGDGYGVLSVAPRTHVFDLWRVDDQGARLLVSFTGIGNTWPASHFDGRTWIANLPMLATEPRLIATDGTAAGTVVVPLRAGIGRIRFLGEASGSLWMIGRDGAVDMPLLRLDRGASQPVEAGRLNLGSGSTAPFEFVQLGQGFVFWASESIWWLDPLVGIPAWLADSEHGWSGGGMLGAGVGRVFFRLSDVNAGLELGVTDGTAAGTRLLRDLNNAPAGTFSSGPRSFTAFANRAAFAVMRRDGAREVWLTDGTPAGTTRGLSGLDSVFGMTALGDRVFVSTRPTLTERRLYVTDGTVAGSRRVDQPGGPSLFAIPGPVPFGGDVIGFDGASLVASDGTSVRVVAGLPTDFVMPRPARLGEQVFFQLGEGGVTGTREVSTGLWITDGSASGTRRIGVHPSYYPLGGGGLHRPDRPPGPRVLRRLPLTGTVRAVVE